jgi:hypothetical protein
MTDAAQRFKDRILHNYFVRCDMSLILAVVVAVGLLSSKLLLECGVHSLALRYPLALIVSFASFLLLIRVWIWYVFCRKTLNVFDGDSGGIQLSGGGGNTGAVHFGGGDSGGGGASDSWGESAAPRVSSSSGGGGGSGFDLDLGDDWFLIALVIAVVLSIVCASGYLVYAAPHLLPEAAWQATLAGGLARVAKPQGRENWLRCVIRSSWIPFAIVFCFVIALAWVAHSHCPSAVKLADALHCPAI